MQIRVLGVIAVLAFSAAAPVALRAETSSVAQGELALTLEEAVALALRDNRSLRSVRLRRAVDRFDLFLARRAYYPTGGVSLSAIRRKSSDGPMEEGWTVAPDIQWRSPIGTSVSAHWSQSGDFQTHDTLDSFSASVRQPLLRGAGLDVNMAPLRQARITADLQQLAEEDEIARLIDQVTLAYRGLIQAQEGVVLAELALQRSRQLLETNQTLIDAGRMAAADIIQTQSEVATQEVSLLESRRGLDTARRALLTLLALDPSTPVAARVEEEVAPIDIDPEAAVSLALENRRDLRAQRLSFQSLEIAEVVARNSRLWDVSVVASFNRFSPVSGRDREGHSVGLQLDVPLGDFSGRRQVLSARTALHTARLAYDDSLQRVESDVREAVANVQSRWLQLKMAERAQALAARSVEVQQERLRAGRASNFEVLTLQNSLRSADAQALSARIAYLNALTALDQQMGRTLETWRISLEP